MIKIKRVYEPAQPSDGRRFLVDRVWPRGVRKDAADVEAWVKDAGRATNCGNSSATIHSAGGSSVAAIFVS